MINIAKFESISTTENCLLNIFFAISFFTNWIIPYSSHSHLVKIDGFKYNMDKILYNILGNEWEVIKFGNSFFGQSISI